MTSSPSTSPPPPPPPAPFKLPSFNFASSSKAYSLLPSSSPSSHSPAGSTVLSRLPPPRRLLLPVSLAVIALLSILSLTSSSSTKQNVYSYISRTKPTSSASSGTSRLADSGASSSSSTSGEDPWVVADRPLPIEAGLDERLKAWSVAPRNEPADWVARNLQTCPDWRIKPNQNSQMLENSALLWASQNSTVTFGLRDEMINYLRNCEKEGKMGKDAWGSGRGLVFTAGNADTFSRVLLTLKLLHRHLNSPLPSEIFSFPGEIPTPALRAELEALGAKLRTVENAVRDPTKAKSYHIKSTAIIRSRFREVLYLDSDNMPTGGLGMLKDVFGEDAAAIAEQPRNMTAEQWGDPTGLWESKAYRRLGVMFWPDYWRTHAANPIWAMIGVGCRDEWEQEAGQIIIDKKLHLDALLLSEWMMDSSRFKFWFNFSDGDKDMFRFAFLALRKRWGLPGRYVAVGALPRNSMSGFCGHTMLQHDHLGRPLFVHANLLKQIPSGVGKGYAWGKSRSLHSSPNSMQLPQEADKDVPEVYIDHDVDCDMLANAANDGVAISPAPPAVRRRAVLEKGLRPFFHGGWVSALCIDMRWEDPRSGAEVHWARLAAAGANYQGNLDDVDVSYTVSSDGLEIKFDDPLEVLEWKDDPRLRDFEEVFFEEGGKLNGPGF